MSENVDKKADVLSEINRVMMSMERIYKTPHSIVKCTKQYFNGVGLASAESYADALKVCLLIHGLDDVPLS